jgi:hypothetical protein
MNPTKTGLYSTNVGDRFILLYWDGEDWVDQDGIRPCYKKVQWTGKPLFVPALRTWVGLTDEDKKKIATAAGCTEDDDGHIVTEIFRLAEAKLKERNT